MPAKKKTTRKKGRAATIPRGQCRTTKGSVRICATKDGKLYTTSTPKRRSKKTTGKAKPCKYGKVKSGPRKGKCRKQPARRKK